MPKFRKKPVVIEAFQMTRERRWDNSEWPEWLHKAWNRGPGEGGVWPDPEVPDAPGHECAAELICGTLEGGVDIPWDHWLIKGVKDEIYPCDPDIFELTYERVVEEAAAARKSL